MTNTQDEIDRFRSVAHSRLAAIEEDIEQLCEGQLPTDRQAGLMRQLHTLKGESELLEFDDLAHIAHALEDMVLGSLQDDPSLYVDLLRNGLEIARAELMGHGSQESVSAFLNSTKPDANDDEEDFFDFSGGDFLSEEELQEAEELLSSEDTSDSLVEGRIIFREESQQLMTALQESMLSIEQDLASRAPLDSLFRALHTLKGSGRIMELAKIGQVAHVLEDLVGEIRDGRQRMIRPTFDLIQEGIDKLGDMLALADFGEGGDISPILAVLTGSELPKAQQRTPQAATIQAPAAQSSAESRYVRVQSEQLGLLSEHSGEFQLRQRQHHRAILDLQRIATQLSDELHLLRLVIRREHAHGESALVSSLLNPRTGIGKIEAYSKEVNQRILAMMDQTLGDDIRITELADNVQEMRLLPLSSALSKFPRAARKIARALGKSVNVSIEGGDAGIDKEVVNCLDGPLTHLLRNSLDHGIEDPETRERVGKPEVGSIVLSGKQDGASITLRISDDGKGIDPSVIRAATVQKGVLSAGAAEATSDEEILSYLFAPGFSTAKEVTEISGRGVGLDSVRIDIEKLGGSVAITSEIGVGTTFALTLPISMSFSSALLFRLGSKVFGFAAKSVERVMPYRAAKVVVAGLGLGLQLGDGQHAVPLHGLGGLLGDTNTLHDIEDEAAIIVVDDGSHRIAVIVDKVMGEVRTTQHALGGFLGGVSLVTGTAAIETGELACFLSIPQLITLSRSEGMRAKKPNLRMSTQQRILVVEDSEITRDMVVSTFMSLGYLVTEAVDGADALLRIEENIPDLIITDLDMPVIDGFTLLGKITSNPKYRHIPVVVVTSRETVDGRRACIDQGAALYICKSQLRTKVLRAEVEKLLGDRAARVTES